MADPELKDGSIDWGHTLKREPSSPAASAPAAVPSGAGRYETVGILGEGGMGRVLQATDRQFSRMVAIKELRADRSDAAARERFETEALITGNLEHPGIPAVYERGHKDDASPYYVMRRVVGLTLDQALAEAGDELAERLKLLPVVMKAAQTVGYAHAQGVVHRDLKPQNILVGKHGEVVVVDWGLAKARGMVLQTTSGEHVLGPGASGETVAGSVLGTPAYMAPEQAQGRLDLIDERTDVFALGAVLYQVLTGRRPYGGDSSAQVIAAAVSARPEPIPQKVPASLRAICQQAMARSPDERFRNALQLSEALEHFAADAYAQTSKSSVSLWANIASGAAVLSLVATYVAISFFLPAITTIGPLGFLNVAFTLASLVLSGVEDRTRGRFALWPLSVCFAFATLLFTLAGTAGQVGRFMPVFDTATPGSPAFNEAALNAVGFAVTVMINGTMLTSLQAVVAAIVRRRVLLASGR